MLHTFVDSFQQLHYVVGFMQPLHGDGTCQLILLIIKSIRTLSQLIIIIKNICFIRMETEKEIEYKSTIMEMRNFIKNQERVIEELMLNILNIKIENEEVAK